MTDSRGKKQEIQHLIDEEFDVEFHPVYLSTFLEDLGLSYAIPRTKRPSRPENAEEILDERVADAFVEETDEPHNQREGDAKKGGSLTRKSVRMAELSLDFSTRPILNHKTTHSDSTPWMIHILPDRW